MKDQAEIVRLMGLSRARVTQLMQLRWLAPAMQKTARGYPTRRGRR